MKQKTYLMLTLAVGLLSSIAARAECQIQLSQTRVNYDPVTRGELLARPGNNLSSSELRSGDDRELEIMVNCDHPAPITLQFIGPAKEGESYRFGERGRATLVLHDVTIDDRPVLISGTGNRGSSMAFSSGNVLRFWKDGSLALGTTLRGKVTVSTWMPADATKVGEHQNWQLEGSFVVGGG